MARSKWIIFCTVCFNCLAMFVFCLGHVPFWNLSGFIPSVFPLPYVPTVLYTSSSWCALACLMYDILVKLTAFCEVFTCLIYVWVTMCSVCVLFITCPWSVLFGTCLFFVLLTHASFVHCLPRFTTCSVVHWPHMLRLCSICSMFLLCPDLTMCSWCVLFTRCSWSVCSVEHQCLASGLTRH